MQEIAFAYGKEEKEVAISALQSTLLHGQQRDLDEQAVWRSTRAVVSVVINAANGEGLSPQEVLERAMATIPPPRFRWAGARHHCGKHQGCNANGKS